MPTCAMCYSHAKQTDLFDGQGFRPYQAAIRLRDRSASRVSENVRGMIIWPSEGRRRKLQAQNKRTCGIAYKQQRIIIIPCNDLFWCSYFCLPGHCRELRNNRDGCIN